MLSRSDRPTAVIENKVKPEKVDAPKNEVAKRKVIPERSPESAAWGKWYKRPRYRKARERFLTKHPFCAVCGRPATDLDHIIPHRGSEKLFWDQSNWQGLCHSCHSKKTIEELGLNKGKEE